MSAPCQTGRRGVDDDCLPASRGVSEGSSKKYACEFNRDTGWVFMGEAGFEPVRMVAIDEDWSALRFRRAEFIKTMTRSTEYRFSAQAKARKGKGGASSK